MTRQPNVDGDDALVPVMRLIAGKCERSLRHLHTATSPMVYGVAFRVLRSRHDAEEVAGDVFLQVWKCAGEFDRRRGSVHGWLASIARHRAIDRIRQRRTMVPLDDSHDTRESHALAAACCCAAEEIFDLQVSGSIDRALATLSQLRRELIRLAFAEGLSHPQIALRVGLPVGTVKSHIRRALGNLRTALTWGRGVPFSR